MFAESCLPWVPEQGTVGASGDLAPLSHLALGLMGEGHMWSPQTGWGDAAYVNSRLVQLFIYLTFNGWEKLLYSIHDCY